MVMVMLRLVGRWRAGWGPIAVGIAMPAVVLFTGGVLATVVGSAVPGVFALHGSVEPRPLLPFGAVVAG